jgi:hypothetical protein
VIGLGGALMVLGLGSFVLPLIGYQWTVMSWLEAWQPWAGILVTLIGLGFIAWGTFRRRGNTQQPPA